eukprot:CAMPEP_0117428544 /NCGR_PEP_ID=MMETSP0758-20121206/8223_1 /TAXON_ID=63605 /ORGANISM="Percolomonas cosmopolitus, Strain AE-1 (ATCC 50343)" /LENGTH=457 /DNA_ID=CAMNT_0005214949 /DNA_START=18 /DNA_END=1391 /DNA_ORIENTATION=+
MNAPQQYTITIYSEANGRTQNQTVTGNETVYYIKQKIIQEWGMQMGPEGLQLRKDGNILQENQSLHEAGIHANDLLVLAINMNYINNTQQRTFQPQQQQQQSFQPQQQQMYQRNPIERFQEMIQKRATTEEVMKAVSTDKNLLIALINYHPQIAEWIIFGKANELEKNLAEIQERAIRPINEQQFKELPVNVKLAWARKTLGDQHERTQKYMEESIHEENLHKNYLDAMEELPESFGRVVMLFIKVKINNKDTVALIDTGAQMSVISEKKALNLGLGRWINKRFEGKVHGVGTSNIIGRICKTEMFIGDASIDTSLTVLENQKHDAIDIIIGLDLMKSHGIIVDLQQNVLRVGNTSIPFLSEGELPKDLKSPMPTTPSGRISESIFDQPQHMPPQQQIPPPQQPQMSGQQQMPPLSSEQLEKVNNLCSICQIPRPLAIATLTNLNWNLELAISSLLG